MKIKNIINETIKYLILSICILILIVPFFYRATLYSEFYVGLLVISAIILFLYLVVAIYYYKTEPYRGSEFEKLVKKNSVFNTKYTNSIIDNKTKNPINEHHYQGSRLEKLLNHDIQFNTHHR